MTRDELIKALGGRGNKAPCPVHGHGRGRGDRNASLSIDEGADGKILVRCHGGCEQSEVLDALKGRGLWPNGEDRSSPPSRTRSRPSTPPPSNAAVPDFRALLKTEPSSFWDYRAADGALLGYTARIEGRDGKKVLPITFNGKTWTLKGFPEPRPLYGLPALAERLADPVLVCEGEKAACAAQALLEDYVVITWPGGTSQVDDADWSPLAGRRVTLWPDADPPGKKAMNALATILLRIGAASVHAVKLPEGLPEGWDLADDIPADMDIEALIATAVDMRAARLKSLGLVSASSLLAREFTEPRYAVPGIVPEGCAILAGKPKSGKSWLALGLSEAVASGGVALASVQCEPGPVLYLALEDTERRLWGRLRAVLQGREPPPDLDLATRWRPMDEGGLDDLRAWLEAHPNARLVIIDTLAKVRGKPDRNQGVYAQDYAAITPIKALADEFSVPFLLVHHQRKEKADDPLETISGTAGLTGAVDTVIVLKSDSGSPFGVLYVRGRDIEESESAMQFDKETGRWTKLGSADDFRKSQERKEIIRALIDAGSAATPAEVAKIIGKRRDAVRQMLRRMAKAGEIVDLGNGTYMAKDEQP